MAHDSVTFKTNTMEKKLTLPHKILIYGVPLLVISSTLYLALGGYLQQHPNLVMPLTLDLMITVPIIYFLAIRKTDIPKFSIISIFVIGTVISTKALPHEAFPALDIIEMIVLPIVELGVISFLLYFFIKKRNEFVRKKQDSDDFLTILNEVVKESLGTSKVGVLLATELAFMYYGFFVWKKITPKENEYTYHIKSGLGITLGTIGAVLVIEAFAMHFLIELWSVVAAWILTIGSIYAIIQIMAHIKSCSRRFVRIGEQHLNLKYGLFGDVDIDWNNIISAEAFRKTPRDMDGFAKLALVDGLESHNIKLELKEPITIKGAYGIKKEGKSILLFIDKRDEFLTALNARLNHETEE